MCIMEVRPGQHSSTIMQAQAHNVKTVLSDLDLFEKLATARHDDETLRVIHETRGLLSKAYAAFLGSFGDMLAADLQDGEGHWNHDHSEHDHGRERSFSEVIDNETHKAKNYESR